jgi:tRNA-dihydrouridine synthase
MNQYEKDKKTYLNLINQVDADFFIVHARHGKERDKNPADFSIYKECVKTKKIIIANGDIETIEQIQFLKSIGVKGAMIARSAVKNPDIFSLLKRQAKQKD